METVQPVHAWKNGRKTLMMMMMMMMRVERVSWLRIRTSDHSDIVIIIISKALGI